MNLKQKQQQRLDLLKGSLPHIEESQKWSVNAFLKAGADQGEEAWFYHLFPEGLSQTVLVYGQHLDLCVAQDIQGQPFHEWGTTKKIEAQVLSRIQHQCRYTQAARALLWYIADIRHGAIGLKLLAQTVDTMWHQAQDRSTDFNYYTKRALLGVIYTNTLLYRLSLTTEQQQTEKQNDQEKTSAFFSRQTQLLFKMMRCMSLKNIFKKQKTTP